MRKLNFLVLSLISFLSFAFSNPIWYDFNQGYSVAASNNKPLMIYFFQEDCEYCEQMSETTLQSSFVTTYLQKHFVLSYDNLSTPKGRIIGRQFIVLGTPTTVFLNPKNDSVIYRVFGFQTPTSFFFTLRHVCKVAKSQGLDC